MMTVVDVDIEEVDDRVEMLKETIESLEQNQLSKNVEMFKIVSFIPAISFRFKLYFHHLELNIPLHVEGKNPEPNLLIQNGKSGER